MAGRHHTKLSHIAIGMLMVAAFSLVGCAGPVRSTETYPTPLPLVQQPMYLLASAAPEFFGYTYMDEVYQETTVPYRYHWRGPVR